MLEYISNQTLDAMLVACARISTKPQALAAQSAVIILCVTGTPQVKVVLAKLQTN